MQKRRRKGRPQKYKKMYAELAFTFCSLGASDTDLAKIIGVSKSTINRWKKRKPDFWDSLKRGKMLACAKVASALYKRAIGYETTEIKTYFNAQNEIYRIEEVTLWVHGDVRAMKLILETKYPQFWKK